jgi:hypothetical protein
MDFIVCIHHRTIFSEWIPHSVSHMHFFSLSQSQVYPKHRVSGWRSSITLPPARHRGSSLLDLELGLNDLWDACKAADIAQREASQIKLLEVRFGALVHTIHGLHLIHAIRSLHLFQWFVCYFPVSIDDDYIPLRLIDSNWCYVLPLGCLRMYLNVCFLLGFRPKKGVLHGRDSFENCITSLICILKFVKCIEHVTYILERKLNWNMRFAMYCWY